MGQKVNPVGLRLGINRGWDSVWYAKKKDFGSYLIEDFKIREYKKKNVVNSGVSKVMIERTSNKCFVTIYTSRPGFVIGKNSNLGESISTSEAEDYIFGKVLFNDWSARDIQKWEYVPLGPFLGKSFASSMSPWVVTLEALDLFRIDGPEQNPKVLPYLQYKGLKNYDINLEVAIEPDNSKESIVSSSNFKYMYWNMSQQLAHHTINGCNLNIGDLMASGTISGKDKGSYGSMLELSWGGKKPVILGDGNSRVFINDNDTVIMRGYCEKNGKRVGFGEVRTKLLGSK